MTYITANDSWDKESKRRERACFVCGGSGRIPVDPPYNRRGFAVAHYRLCRCNLKHPERLEMNEELE